MVAKVLASTASTVARLTLTGQILLYDWFSIAIAFNSLNYSLMFLLLEVPSALDDSNLYLIAMH